LSDLKQLQAIIRDTKKVLFSKPPKIDSAELAEGIQFILEKNKLLNQYSHNQRDTLRLEISKAGRAHKAISSYLTSAS